jgi:hypothetical protein
MRYYVWAMGLGLVKEKTYPQRYFRSLLEELARKKHKINL